MGGGVEALNRRRMVRDWVKTLRPAPGLEAGRQQLGRSQKSALAPRGGSAWTLCQEMARRCSARAFTTRWRVRNQALDLVRSGRNKDRYDALISVRLRTYPGLRDMREQDHSR